MNESCCTSEREEKLVMSHCEEKRVMSHEKHMWMWRETSHVSHVNVKRNKSCLWMWRVELIKRQCEEKRVMSHEKRVMSHAHVNVKRNESCLSHERVISQEDVLCGGAAHEWVIPHMWICHITWRRTMWGCRTWMSHTAHVNVKRDETCLSHEYVISHEDVLCGGETWLVPLHIHMCNMPHLYVWPHMCDLKIVRLHVISLRQNSFRTWVVLCGGHSFLLRQNSFRTCDIIWRRTVWRSHMCGHTHKWVMPHMWMWRGMSSVSTWKSHITWRRIMFRSHIWGHTYRWGMLHMWMWRGTSHVLLWKGHMNEACHNRIWRGLIMRHVSCLIMRPLHYETSSHSIVTCLIHMRSHNETWLVPNRMWRGLIMRHDSCLIECEEVS